MTPFDAVVGGGAAGLLGAAAAHALTVMLDRGLGAEAWLRGPYGPQFFPVAFYTGVFYAAIAGAAGRRRAAAAAAGFLVPFLTIALPMALLTRASGWGMPRGADGTPQWAGAVRVLYALAIWGAVGTIGFLGSRTRGWRGVLAAAAGSIAGYVGVSLFLWLVPEYGRTRWNPVSLLPSPVNLLDGLMSGAGLCLALSLDQKLSRRNA